MRGEVSARTKTKWGAKLDAAANNAAAVTLAAAGADERHVVDTVYWSYNAAPANGKLTITNGVTTLEWDITSAGPGYMPLRMAEDEGFDGGYNTAVTITLAAGGGSVVGKVFVKYR